MFGARPLFGPGITLVLAATILGTILGACGGDDDGDEIVIADFEGTWTATAYVITATDGDASIDVVAAGAEFTMVVDDAGNLDGEVVLPEALGGPATITFTGSASLASQELMNMTFTPELPPLLTNDTSGFTLDGDTLTLTDEDMVFDFGAGDVSVRGVITARRD